jgi:hypothetical protein
MKRHKRVQGGCQSGYTYTDSYMNIVQASIKPRRYIGQTPGRHAWSRQHRREFVNVKMTALSDETEGVRGDDHVGEAATCCEDLAGQ